MKSLIGFLHLFLCLSRFTLSSIFVFLNCNKMLLAGNAGYREISSMVIPFEDCLGVTDNKGLAIDLCGRQLFVSGSDSSEICSYNVSSLGFLSLNNCIANSRLIGLRTDLKMPSDGSRVFVNYFAAHGAASYFNVASNGSLSEGKKSNAVLVNDLEILNAGSRVIVCVYQYVRVYDVDDSGDWIQKSEKRIGCSGAGVSQNEEFV